MIGQYSITVAPVLLTLHPLYWGHLSTTLQTLQPLYQWHMSATLQTLQAIIPVTLQILHPLYQLHICSDIAPIVPELYTIWIQHHWHCLRFLSNDLVLNNTLSARTCKYIKLIRLIYRFMRLTDYKIISCQETIVIPRSNGRWVFTAQCTVVHHIINYAAVSPQCTRDASDRRGCQDKKCHKKFRQIFRKFLIEITIFVCFK